MPTVRKAGGDVFTKAYVDRINVKNGWFGRYATGVTVKDSAGNACEINAPLVISSAGLYNTDHMVPELKLNSASGLPVGSFASVFVGFDDRQDVLKVPNEVGVFKYSPKTSPAVDVDVNGERRTLQFTRDLVFYSSIACHDPTSTANAHMELLVIMDYDMYSGIGPDHVISGGPLISKKTRNPKDGYHAFKNIIRDELLDDMYKAFPQLNGHV